jgi:hypothetical protein
MNELEDMFRQNGIYLDKEHIHNIFKIIKTKYHNRFLQHEFITLAMSKVANKKLAIFLDKVRE